MGENLHDIDKLFLDSLDGHEETPPGSVWDAIDNNLDKNSVATIKRKYNDLKKVAVALVVLLMGAVAWGIYSNKPLDEPAAIKNTSQQNAQPVGPAEAENELRKANNDNLLSDTAIENKSKIDSKATEQLKVETANDKTSSSVIKKQVNIQLTTAAVTKPVVKSTSNLQTKKENNVAGKQKKDLLTENENKIADNAVEKSKHPEMEMAGKKSNGIDNNLNTVVAAEDNEIFYAKRYAVSETLATERVTVDANAFKPGEYKMMDDNISLAGAVSEISIVCKQSKPFRFSLMPFYSPHISFNRIEIDDHDGRRPQQHDRDEIRHGEQHENNNTLGLQIAMPLNKHWGIQSGVSYTIKKIDIDPKKVFAKLDDDGIVKYRFDCSSGYTYLSPKTGVVPAVGDSADVTASINNLQYIGIPFAFNYTITNKKFNIIPAIGASANFLVKQQIETALVQGSSKENRVANNIQGLKPIYFNANAAVGFEYNISRQIALDVIPSANFALGAINKNAAVKSYPNSFAISGGVRFNF